MQFGSFMEFHRREGSTQADAFREAFDHIALAEELGLDAVWLAESHFNPARSVLSSPHAIASAIAARTKRLKVGTAVSVLPLGNPLRTAEEAATIDHISEGRFEFGVGRSGLPGSYEGYNIPYAESPRPLLRVPRHHPEGVARRAFQLRRQLLHLQRCLPRAKALPESAPAYPHRRDHIGDLPRSG